MCIYIRYSMSIIEKVFKYGETELSVIKCKDDIWFRGTPLEILSKGLSMLTNQDSIL